MKIRIALPGGRSVRLDATDVRGLDVAELRSLLDAVAQAIGDTGDAEVRPEKGLRG